jgi:hypothetical protein
MQNPSPVIALIENALLPAEIPDYLVQAADSTLCIVGSYGIVQLGNAETVQNRAYSVGACESRAAVNQAVMAVRRTDENRTAVSDVEEHDFQTALRQRFLAQNAADEEQGKNKDCEPIHFYPSLRRAC